MASRKKDPQLEAKLLELVAPNTAGDPMSSRKWLNCRLQDIQERLGKHRVSTPVISRLLKKQDYHLRGNNKKICAKQDPEHNQQFEHIQAQRQQHEVTGGPKISTDTKKKELIGNFKNSGQIWCQAAEQVNAMISNRMLWDALYPMVFMISSSIGAQSTSVALLIRLLLLWTILPCGAPQKGWSVFQIQPA